jgi:hypothetical protein
MGIGFVLLFWAVFGMFFGGVVALIFGGVAWWLTPKNARQRKLVLITSALFPFVCLAWAGGVFVFQAIVNGEVLHRDPGLGDVWMTPLPNGYAIEFIDVTDYGWVYNPKTQGTDDAIGEQRDAIAGVRTLQVAGHYILGGAGPLRDDTPNSTSDVTSYFLMDTEAGNRTDMNTYDQLNSAATQLGVKPQLEPIYTIYRRYRFTWFDALSAVLLLVPPALAGLALTRWILRIRRIE